jgi:hypothetical protein
MAAHYGQVAAMLGHSCAARLHVPEADPYLLAHLRVAELRAVSGLQLGLAGLAREVADRRLALYRDYVGSTVTRISPLLRRWCGLEGVQVDDLARRLAPDRPWTTWLCGHRPPNRSRSARWSRRTGIVGEWEVDYHGLQRFAFAGTVVRTRATGRGYGLRVLHDRLEMAAFLGTARIRTFGTGGEIVLPGELPATLVAGLAGTPLDRLIDHDLLNGAGCVITDVDEPTGWGTRIAFSQLSEAWRMPWARDAG